ncbi:T-complex 11 [Quillaja saponaria]|uniref:T-complex 11 n=1 Tax=Quillaja saponaria TaxID=32244 RepID=A0AAD7P9F1_QUISA|nr:T-complex 11 [Quillaja saponaria]
MAAGVELPEGKVGGGIVMEFPVGDAKSFNSSPVLPRRLRRRLLVSDCKSPTMEEIEAKLRGADLRRQQFYDKLSSKARAKARSLSRSSSREEDLGQRLQAKLQAAEQKRLSILAKAQMRLARLDELRLAAKTGVEMRHEKERAKLGSKVKSRVQQAEANRLLILKACRQKRAAQRERSSQSLLRRMARENRYKECIRAAIHQKRAAAETKRLGFLEAEKKKAHALQVQHVAKLVSHQRDIERRQMRDQLEDRLQRARRQRAEYLKQRGRLDGSSQVDSNRVDKQGELLSRKLARYWQRFLRLRRTTFSLTKAYDTLGINEKSVKSMPFEQLALLMESTSTLQTVRALLDRIESRLKVSRAVAPANHMFSLDNIDHLLNRVVSPKKIATPRSSTRNRQSKKIGPSRELTRSMAKSSRYPVRIVMCAYMVLGHPDAVVSGKGDREIALSKSAEEFVKMLELLIKIIIDGPTQISDEEPETAFSKRWTFRSQLAAFDKAWCAYLNCFVAWKVKDAQLLEDDLVRAACQLEVSMIQTCKLTPEGDSGALTHDMKAILKQVSEDQRLLREKVQHLSGDAGTARMERALSETRSTYFKARENGSPLGSPITHLISASPPKSVVSSNENSNLIESDHKPNRVARSLFRENDNSPRAEPSSSAPRTCSDGQLSSSIEKLVMENEFVVNEFLHEQRPAFSNGFGVSDHNQSSIKVKTKETMEKAFWDGIMESINQESVNFDRIVQLMREVRDEIFEMAPENWKEDIFGAIDLEIFSQVLKSGNLDVDYLGKILEFSLVTLQKLSAPVNDELMKTTHQKLLLELSEICQSGDDLHHSCLTALIQGLRFVLEQIQNLKQEISKARIRIIEPLLKGPTGMDYLRNAFANRWGSPSDACTSLPVTLRWLSSAWSCKDLEWEEHTDTLSALTNCDSPSQGKLPSTILRTGGNFLVNTDASRIDAPTDARTYTGNQQPECRGEKVDLLTRLGLLKLVTGISGLTQDDLPETLLLNFSRLRAVQSQIQKIVVIATSILIFRQVLLSEQVVANLVDIESSVLRCVERLSELLDRVEDAGLEDIVDVISGFFEVGDYVMDQGRLQSRKIVTARMLAKSLQAGDAVFEKVSCAVYSATRAVVLGGSGPRGRELAEMALRKVGAVMLTERVVEVAEVLVVASIISLGVHGPWYMNLTDHLCDGLRN